MAIRSSVNLLPDNKTIHIKNIVRLQYLIPILRMIFTLTKNISSVETSEKTNVQDFINTCTP